MANTLLKWKNLRKLPSQERDRILKSAAEAAEKDYVQGSDLRSFKAHDDIYDETK